MSGGAAPVAVVCALRHCEFPIRARFHERILHGDRRDEPRGGVYRFGERHHDTAAAPSAPAATPPPPLTIACPANVSITSPTGGATPVSYNPPQVSGGVPPLAVSCAPSSGSPFNVGNTNVACVVADTAQRTAACGFVVTVRAPPRLSVTKFLAFGDSFTEGIVSVGPMMLLMPVATPAAYPTKVLGMLEERYTAQDFTMVNQGIAGERAETGAGRLPGALDAARSPKCFCS